MKAPRRNSTDFQIQTEAKDISMDSGSVLHFQVPASQAVATSANGIKTAVNLGSATQNINSGITNPAYPRNLSIVGNVSGITGNVVITGKNAKLETISETIALNGTTTVLGNKAFRKVTNIQLPAQSHTPTAQVETIQVTHKCDVSGNIVVRVTAAGLTGSPVDVTVALLDTDDNASKVATKIRAALAANAAIAALFTVGGSTDIVSLTKKTPAANDTTLAIALQDAGTSAVTVGASTDATAGVQYDTVAVGWGDKLGLPYKLAHNTVFKTYLDNTLEGTEPTVAVSATALESNTIDLNSALNGTVVDAYLIV